MNITFCLPSKRPSSSYLVSVSVITVEELVLVFLIIGGVGSSSFSGFIAYQAAKSSSLFFRRMIFSSSVRCVIPVTSQLLLTFKEFLFSLSLNSNLYNGSTHVLKLISRENPPRTFFPRVENLPVLYWKITWNLVGM